MGRSTARAFGLSGGLPFNPPHGYICHSKRCARFKEYSHRLVPNPSPDATQIGR
jgi:hypothetical protein